MGQFKIKCLEPTTNNMEISFLDVQFMRCKNNGIGVDRKNHGTDDIDGSNVVVGGCDAISSLSAKLIHINLLSENYNHRPSKVPKYC
jgi:hypothetical protein